MTEHPNGRRPEPPTSDDIETAKAEIVAKKLAAMAGRRPTRSRDPRTCKVLINRRKRLGDD